MSIPKSPPKRYTTSRQLIAGDDVNNLSDQLFSFQQLTALGAAQASAVPINASNVEILSGSANNTGAILPTAYPGLTINILNNSLNTTNIYGSGSDVIQNGGTTYAAAAAAVAMATLVSATFFCIKAGFWQRGLSG
jgi:hypothetical protein